MSIIFIRRSALYAASHRGSLESLKLLLEQGVNLRDQSSDQSSSFHENSIAVAAINGHADVVRFLARNGSNIDGVPEHPLFIFASLRGKSLAVKTLLEEGADIHVNEDRFGNAISAADFMRHDETVQLLLDYGATIDTTISSPGHVDVMEMLNNLVSARSGPPIDFLRMAEFGWPLLYQQILTETLTSMWRGSARLQ